MATGSNNDVEILFHFMSSLGIKLSVPVHKQSTTFLNIIDLIYAFTKKENQLKKIKLMFCHQSGTIKIMTLYFRYNLYIIRIYRLFNTKIENLLHS